MNQWRSLRGVSSTSSYVVSIVNIKAYESAHGFADMLYDRSNSYDFFSITKDLEPPGAWGYTMEASLMLIMRC